MVKIKVKWGKEMYEMDVDVDLPVEVFKAQLQSLTNVPAERQKITGVKGGQLKDDANLAAVGLRDGMTLLMIGTAEAIAVAPTKPITFAEDQKGHAKDSVESNGLVNIGNTCYLNSAVQLLRHMPEVRALSSRCTAPLDRQLSVLFSRLDATKSAVVPAQFYQSFVRLHPSFGETDSHGHPMQQDSQEALSMLLRSLHNHISTSGSEASLKRLFAGEHASTVKCIEAAEEAVRTERIPFTILPCNISDEVQTLEAGLEKAMEEDFVGVSEALGREAQYHRSSRIASLPEYLFVHFLRFTWRGDTKKKAKVLKPVTFPLVLDVCTLCVDSLQKELEPGREMVKKKRDEYIEKRRKAREKTHFEEGNPTSDQPADLPKTEQLVPGNTSGFYELCGVISHRGRDADGGHYVAWIKKKNVWIVFDDENVGQVTEEDILRLRGVGEAHIAYVLLYRSRNPDTGDLPLPL